MRRVTLIVVGWIAGVVAAATWVADRYGAEAFAAGQALYPHRVALALLDPAHARHAPAVVWLGDSTLMDTEGNPSYPTVLDSKGLRGLGSIVVGLPSLDFFGFYTLMGPALALRPRVVVLVADLRVFQAAGGTRGFSDLAAGIPADELLHATTLPIAVRSLTAPRLLLARLLATSWGEWTFLVAEGLRSGFHEAADWSALGPVDAAGWRPGRLGFARTRDAYDTPITPAHPLVAFAGAAVRMATAHGVRAVVVVTPIPWEWLASAGAYDQARYARRIDALRAVVEANGGRLVDFHRALVQREFRDLSGHFSPAGSVRMAALLEPTLAEELRKTAHPVAR